jgi:hypothetical protein
MKTIAPWYELVGISLVLFGLLVYYGSHRYQGIGGLTR